jgi:hypothetical protein
MATRDGLVERERAAAPESAACGHRRPLPGAHELRWPIFVAVLVMVSVGWCPAQIQAGEQASPPRRS